MDVPRNAQVAGLYIFGVHPGAPGVSVIAGHRSWGKQPALFDSLHTVSVGDIISVRDSKNNRVDFIVQKISRYPADAVIPDIFTARDSVARLNLITCEGSWNNAKNSSNERLVVYTVRK
jgi:LPXTG-site transpeptidase (sortase) family protein